MSITFEDVKNNEEFKIYVKKADELVQVLGYTDHSAGHTLKVAANASKILSTLGYDERTVELANISAYIHDIGSMINRKAHAHTGAIMAFSILTRMGMHPDEIAIITSAVGHHDEDTGNAISPVSAAVIIADKTDVRRSRVRNEDFTTFDIHDKVNYSVVESELKVFADKKYISLQMEVDTSICSVMDYFEIFLGRMVMCKRAAEFLGTNFGVTVNGMKLL